MIPRHDLLDPRSPAGLEVFQLTSESIPSCHIYMEAQIFTPDSRRLVVHRSATPHGGDRHDPEHRYLLVDLDATGEKNRLLPLTEETGPTAPSLSPDGQYLYYFLDQTETNGGRLSLKRMKLDGTARETILVLDSPLPGAKARVSCIYPLSTISSDGKRIATSCFLGDGRTNFAPWGMVVFDIEKASADLVLAGPSWCNVHPQYSRSLDPEASHDILVQENHGNVCTPDGRFTKLCSSPGDGGHGADIHVIRDDGSHFRNLPWGRTGKEYCQGHQCRRGRSNTAITTAGEVELKMEISGGGGGAGGKTIQVHEEHIIEGLAVPYDGHTGAGTTSGRRNVLSRSFERPRFFHFATDIAGKRFITDSSPQQDRGCTLYVATLGRPMEDPLQNWTYLLDTRANFWAGRARPHPFLSPDGKMAFFNSDESGVLQAYMIRGLPA